MSRPSQGDPALLADPAAQALLASTNLAHLAYTWTDGTPRCTPIWFHWTGDRIVVCGPAAAPRMIALADGTVVAVTIDAGSWPYSALLVRGPLTVERTVGLPADYRAAAVRYFGPEQGAAWVDGMPPDLPSVRLSVEPRWVGLLDFEGMRRLPSALAG